jgi:hypothetical protein
MQVIRWFIFAGLIAYGADKAFYGGVHADAILYLARNVGIGILLGMLRTL